MTLSRRRSAYAGPERRPALRDLRLEQARCARRSAPRSPAPGPLALPSRARTASRSSCHAPRCPRSRRLPGVAKVWPSPPATTLARRARRLERSARQLAGAPRLATAGNGMKIGIIDDGVDQTHPFFAPAGYTMPPGFPKGDAAYTTAKVIVARAFAPAGATYGRYAARRSTRRSPSTATHVAGIAAGERRDARRAASRISGVAPRAYIGNYKALGDPDRRRRRPRRQRPRDRRRDRGGGRRRHGRDQPLARRARDRARRATSSHARSTPPPPRASSRSSRPATTSTTSATAPSPRPATPTEAITVAAVTRDHARPSSPGSPRPARRRSRSG